MAKAKITITGTGKTDTYTPYAYLLINDEVYTSPQTIEVDLGTICQCRAGRGTQGLCAVLLDEQPVAETTDSYGETSYDLTVNRNYTISLEVATGAIIRITSGDEVSPDEPSQSDGGHNTNISNVAREIESLTVLIGGVSREVESGFVLASGVNREIHFAENKIILRITKAATNANREVVVVDGKNYTEVGEYELNAGLEIRLRVSSAYSWYSSSITVDGTVVVTNSSTTMKEYVLTADTNLAIAFNGNSNQGRIVVTTE